MSNKFRPVQGLEEKILAQPYNEGVVYFATDSGKIYMDARQESKILMGGGGTSVLYANESNVIEYGDMFQISLTSLEDEKAAPKENDLIINSDGKFFRIYNIEGEVITCLLIAVSGTGGGGSDPGATAGSASIDRLDGAALDCLYGESCLIRYKFTAVDSAGDLVGNGQATWSVGGVKKATSIAKQGDNEFDIGPYLSKGDNNVKLSISVDTGGSRNTITTKSWTVNAITLNVEWNYDDTTINKIDEPFQVKWIATGNAPYKAYITLDNYDTRETGLISQFGNLYTYTIPAETFLHGSHKIDLYLESEVNGKFLKTPTISYEAVFIDQEAVDNGSALPVIATSFSQEKMMQYDTVRIPVVIYDPNTQDTFISATLSENDVPIEEWKAENQDHKSGERYYWNYTPTKDGIQKLSITCGATKKNINLIVEKIDLGDVQEVTGYSFKLKASDFAGNDGLKNWKSNNVTAEFSDNFDWINGGIKNELDENGNTRQYISIRNGTTMTINFNPFDKNYIGEKGEGFCFKAIFKATNCRDYDAPAISCFANNRGLRINAQESIIKTNITELSTQYCEDTYIELEIDAWPYDAHENTGKRYLIYWIDGVPAGISLYGTTDDINQGSANVPITIGSEDCDVQLYLVKFYPNHISDEGHLNNFIVDAPNAAEMMKRFKRNDILDPNTKEISPQRLAAANPGVEVHMYDIPYMTTSKEDKVDCNSYLKYKGNGETPVLTGEGFKMRVQGTSSAAYGVAAYNFDTDYKKGKFYDAEGNESSKYFLDDDAIGINYMNTKVNVASSEGANNAVNQEWYNKFQPYKCKYKQKAESENWDRQPRDTMQFNPGIVFFLDRNQVIDNADAYNKNNVFKDTPGYTSNPYYKQYAIGCMGNSKKNTAVFHDETNDLEACVEVGDNQQPQQWMTTYEYLDDYTEAADGAATKNFLDYYEFRYVKWEDKDKELPSMEWMQRWRRLVKWMADNDPSPYEATNHPHGYTGEELDEPVTFGNFTFSGKDGSTVLKGLTISKYAGTYTHDTYEYRMAKMLSECEDYLIMDAVVYHYLFIERHTMVDNVAKNTFWGTEDGVHWQLIKDYDNDTADGNDNEGKLTLHYGIECLDVRDPAKGTKYFNASESVWLNFIHGLYDARRKMFIDRESTGAWSSSTYLAAFDAFQSVIPERCWIEDYYRKYLRPRELGMDSSQFYLKMLDGGKKTHQRKQFERYQEFYMASQYHLAGDQKDIITLRSDAAAGSLDNDYIKITPYADCYVRVNIGQQESISQRAKRGETYEIKFSTKFGNLTDATVYVYPGPLCSELLNLNILNAKTLTLDNAPRLRTVEINNSDSPNEGLESLGFGSNPMLEAIYAKNLTNEAISKSELNLSALKNLKILDTSGSAFSSITFADGGLLETIKIEAPKVLQMSNLSKIETFEITDATKLNNISINNCNFDSYELIKDCLSNTDILSYQLLNVDWLANKAGDIVVKESETDSIPVLDYLLNPLKTTPKDSYKTSLTGKLLIDSTIYNFNESLDVYNKYINADKFVNLDLQFNGSYSKLLKATIVDANDTKVWEKKTSVGANLNADFYASGPNGTFTGFESYEDTIYTYTFLNGYKIIDANNGNVLKEVSGEMPYYNNIAVNVIIKPNFKKEYKKFKVTFYNKFDSENEIFEQKEYAYGTFVADILPAIVPTREDSNLPLREVYGFSGYSLSETGEPLSNNQLSTFAITEEREFYAQFAPMDIEAYFTTEVNNQYYEIQSIFTSYIEDNFTPLNGENYDIVAKEGNYSDVDGLCQIRLLVPKKGKILIPTYMYKDGKKYLVVKTGRGFATTSDIAKYVSLTSSEIQAGPVEGVEYYTRDDKYQYHVLDVSKGFPAGSTIFKENEIKNNGTFLTHVLFKADTEIRQFYDYAFAYDENLVYVGTLDGEGLPYSLRSLGLNCFRGCSNLDFSLKNGVASLGNVNIYEIKSYAFNNTFKNNYDKFYFPSSVQCMATNSFSYIANTIGQLIIGTEDNPSQLDFSKQSTGTSIFAPFQFNANEVNSLIFYTNKYTDFDAEVQVLNGKQTYVRDYFNGFANMSGAREIKHVQNAEV